MRQINIRVENEIGEAFYRFCEAQQIKPYDLLGKIISFYGRGQIIQEKTANNTLTNEELLIEMGYLVKDMQDFARANGEFTQAVAKLFKPYNISIKQLWPEK